MREGPIFDEQQTLTASKLTRFSGHQRSPEIIQQRLDDFVFKLQSYQQQSREEAERRQCPGPRDHPGLEGQDSMSQRPPASRPTSRSPPDGQRIILPSLQIRDDSRAGGRQLEQQQQEHSELRGYPSIQTSPQQGRLSQTGTPTDDWRSGRSRDLAFHSILNPTEPEGALGTPASSGRVSSGNTESPLSAAEPPSHFAPSPTTGTNTFPGQQLPETSPSQEGYRPFQSSQGRPRRILTPKTRTPSAGRGGQTTFDARESPFIAQRGRAGYNAGPGQSDVPPMPTPPAHSQHQQYGLPVPENAPPTGRRPSFGSMQAPGRTPLSESASPSISASSLNPASSQTSPASILYQSGPTQSSGSYFSSAGLPSTMQQTQAGGGMQIQAPSTSGTEGPYSAPPPSSASSVQSASSARQASDPIHLLTITTSQGIYNVPVDMHQASRVADEKRARNAGASARFRQRRKEKEREASTNIEKMQQTTRDLEGKVRDLERERDFYRGERDRMRDGLLSRNPDMRNWAMGGPPSPQAMRTSSFQGPGAVLGGPPPPMNYQPQQSPVERPARRRRTDRSGEFTNVPFTLPPASTLPLVHSPGYAHPGPPNLPPLRMDNPAVSRTSPAAIAPAAATGPPPPPFGPFARGPYDRPWPGPDDGGRQ